MAAGEAGEGVPERPDPVELDIGIAYLVVTLVLLACGAVLAYWAMSL